MTTERLPADAETLYRRLSDSLKAAIAAQRAEGAPEPALIGIHTGGAWLAARLHHELGLQSPLGFLSSAFYRDDLQARGLPGRVQATQIDFEVAGQNIVLIDDILHTGRTIRAALNEIFDYGRPARVTLAVLIDRQGRELPIQPDHVGAEILLQPGERLVLSQQTSGVFDLRIEGK